MLSFKHNQTSNLRHKPRKKLRMNLMIRSSIVDFAQDPSTPAHESITAALIYAAHIANERSEDPQGVYDIPFEDLLDSDAFDCAELTTDEVVLAPYGGGVYCRHLMAAPDLNLAYPTGEEEGEPVMLSDVLAVGEENCNECQAYLELVGTVPPPLRLIATA